eukprot:scaffold255291_cov29-Tisochrysis_lutea.AAC.5
MISEAATVSCATCTRSSPWSSAVTIGTQGGAGYGALWKAREGGGECFQRAGESEGCRVEAGRRSEDSRLHSTLSPSLLPIPLSVCPTFLYPCVFVLVSIFAFSALSPLTELSLLSLPALSLFSLILSLSLSLPLSAFSLLALSKTFTLFPSLSAHLSSILSLFLCTSHPLLVPPPSLLSYFSDLSRLLLFYSLWKWDIYSSRRRKEEGSRQPAQPPPRRRYIRGSRPVSPSPCGPSLVGAPPALPAASCSLPLPVD